MSSNRNVAPSPNHSASMTSRSFHAPQIFIAREVGSALAMLEATAYEAATGSRIAYALLIALLKIRFGIASFLYFWASSRVVNA